MTTEQLLYWIPTGLLLIMMAGSGFAYFANVELSKSRYVEAGFPAWVMYFNALAKILGGVAIVISLPHFLKEFAYAGYLYILLLSVATNIALRDNKIIVAIIGLVLWAASYWQFAFS